MNDSNNEESDAIEPSRGASAEAGFEIDMARLAATMRASRERGVSLQTTIDEVESRRRATLQMAFEGHRRGSLQWWHYWRNPHWAIAYTLLRSQQLRKEANWEAVRKMDRWRCRAMYGRFLSNDMIERLRIAHQTGALSEWRALSMLRAMCCRVSKEGHLRIEPVGRLGLWMGSLILAPMISLLILLCAEVMSSLLDHCWQGCEVWGAFSAMGFVGFWIALVSSSTWGRRKTHREWARIQNIKA